jgi:hypothetical protein
MIGQNHVRTWERKVKLFTGAMAMGVLALDIVLVFSNIIRISTNKFPLAVQ